MAKISKFQAVLILRQIQYHECDIQTPKEWSRKSIMSVSPEQLRVDRDINRMHMEEEFLDFWESSRPWINRGYDSKRR
jgi:hypothetical protein